MLSKASQHRGPCRTGSAQRTWIWHQSGLLLSWLSGKSGHGTNYMNDHTLRVYDSILGLLPDVDNPTPLVRLSRVSPFRHTQVFTKLEWYNPFGAIKDRVAYNMVQDGEQLGVVGNEQKLVEPTSGNTGLGLAMIANAKGYSLTTPLSKDIPIEKRTMLRFFGADVVELDDELCPAPWAPEGAIAKATEIAGQPGFEMLNQYANPANPEAHYRTTGPEIWRQTKGEVTHFVAGMGTCGTIAGAGRFLKERNPEVQVLGVHPSEGHAIPGVRSITQLRQTKFFQPEDYDGLIEVENQEAFDLCQRLNREESITAGPSSAMALSGAFRLVPDEPGNVVVVIFPDSAFKYASSLAEHLDGLSASPTETLGGRNRLVSTMIENARVNPDLTIDVDSAYKRWQSGETVVIDVRVADDFDKMHIPGAVNIPLQELPDRVAELPADLETPLLSVCQRGNLSLEGVLFMASLGYRNARSLTGGTNAWAESFATESS